MENYNQNPPPRNAITAATNNAEVEPASEAQNHESRVAPVTPTRDLASDLIEVFKLLADETRLRILLLLLEEGELNVRTLCDKLDQSQPGVSHHLSLLRLAGFIERRREGKSNYYHVVQEKFEVVLCLLFRTVPGRSAYLQFREFQVEYHPQVTDVITRTGAHPRDESGVTTSGSI